MMKTNIYFDNASTTFPYEEIVETYNKVIKEYPGNPSSIHMEGQKSSRVLDKAREDILLTMHLNDHQVLFTSGATEANNLAIKGACFRYQNRGKHIITSNVEHPSVLETFRQLETLFGFSVTYLPVNENGQITIEQVKSAVKEDTIFVSLMAVNNEVGSINNIEEIAKYLKTLPKVIFHVDAVQAIGKVNINYNDVDMVTIAAHKIHGLNNSGVLIKRKKIELIPLLSGGGQEFGMRSGTNDVALAVSFAKALSLTYKEMKEAKEQASQVYFAIKNYLLDNPSLFVINSRDDNNPFILNFSSLTKKASVIVEALSNLGIMVSSISACHSKKEAGSYVVNNMTHDDKRSANTIRLSFDRQNTVQEANAFIEALKTIIKEIK